MDDQDWTVVTVKRSGSKSGGGSLPYRGSDMTKASGSKNPHTFNAPGSADMRLVEQTEIGKLKRLSPESRKEIVQKRVALGQNQVQLNQMCRFPVNTIREIESGRMCPNPQQLGTLNRILKSSLKYA